MSESQRKEKVSCGRATSHAYLLSCPRDFQQLTLTDPDMAWPENVGILAIELFFPSFYVDQTELEAFDGASTGKYTVLPLFLCFFFLVKSEKKCLKMKLKERVD